MFGKIIESVSHSKTIVRLFSYGCRQELVRMLTKVHKATYYDKNTMK